MKLAIHQPQYFPWPRYVHKVMSADIFVYLDTVQFSKNGLQNRNQIRTAQGALWLTVPVKHEFGRSILETTIADHRAVMKHWKTLAINYARAPGFERWGDELQELLSRQFDSLAELAIASTEWLLEKLDVRTQRIRASTIDGIEGQASIMVASICKALNADTYLTGSGGLSYMNPGDFSAVGTEILIQQWESFSYPQTPAKEPFWPDLSTLDLLLNCPDSAAEKIKCAGSWKRLEE